MVISVPAEDVGALVRISGYVWAGATVKIERVGAGTEEPGISTADLKATLQGVLERRYNADTKLLDLSALGQDADLQKQSIFEKKSTTQKFFPALMKVLEGAFDTPAEKDAAISSVSLANNELVDLTHVTTLSLTLPKLHNLDLSNNSLGKLSSLDNWRRRFFQLEHLVLSGNPIEQNEPEYPAEIMKWYPKLRLLNNIQVRTEEEVNSKATVTDLPFPVRTPLFQDQDGIAENFVRTFFAGFDSDRPALARHYYDDQSDFSYAVNTQAPRDPAATGHTEKQEWDQYIKNSRNLKKIDHLPARTSRLFRGTQAISDAFASLPRTRHPDLATEARKWMIEAHIQPGVPDPSGNSPMGVDGFMIVVHGEYDELDSSGTQVTKKRSFDRTFIIGPGTGPSGVRVVNDMLTVRAYGGAQAFEPESVGEDAQQQNVAPADAVPQLPAGLTVEVAEQMVAELQKQTGMNVQFSKDCLEAAGWDFAKGMETFASVKGNLGPEAFA